MGDKTCGTCIHYRSLEEPVWNGSACHSLTEYCAMGNENHCGYCYPACADYKPDQDYIDFLNKSRDA